MTTEKMDLLKLLDLLSEELDKQRFLADARAGILETRNRRLFELEREVVALKNKLNNYAYVLDRVAS